MTAAVENSRSAAPPDRHSAPLARQRKARANFTRESGSSVSAHLRLALGEPDLTVLRILIPNSVARVPPVDRPGCRTQGIRAIAVVDILYIYIYILVAKWRVAAQISLCGDIGV